MSFASIRSGDGDEISWSVRIYNHDHRQVAEHGILDYIRKQVAQFSINITDQMLQHADFYTTPDFKQTSNSPRTVHENFNGGANDWGVFKPILQEC